MTENSFRSDVADCLREAVVAGADLRAAADMLQRVLDEATADRSLCENLDEISGLVASIPETSPLLPIVAALRTRWTGRATTARIASLQSLGPSAHGPWHAEIASATASFRFDTAAAVAAVAPLMQIDPTFEDIAAWSNLAHEGRWREARPLLAHFSGPATTDNLCRSRALAILAEIDALVRQDYDAAAEALDAAAQLAPRDWRPPFARARIAEERGQLAEAEEAYAAAAAANPRGAEIFRFRAGLHVKLDRLDTAESFALHAATCQINPAAGLEAQIDLYADPRLFAARRDRIPNIIQRGHFLCRDPADVYDLFVSAANAYFSNQDEAAALACLVSAEALAPSRIQAPLLRGSLLQSRGDLHGARREFDHIVKIAPGAVEGYWALAVLAEQTKDGPAMISAAIAAQERAPEWAPVILGRLKQMAIDLLDANSTPSMTRAFYDHVREVAGTEWEPQYRNLLGHLAYWQQDFTQAAGEYRRAIESASVPVARYHGNRSLALEAAEPPADEADLWIDEALAEAQRAVALDGAEPDYHASVRRLCATQSFIATHGKDARLLTPDPTRIRVLLEPGLVPFVTETNDGKEELTAGAMARVEALRTTVASTCSFVLPPIRFADRPDVASGCGWAIQIGGSIAQRGTAQPGSGFDELMNHLDAALLGLLPRIIGHEEAREMLSEHAAELSANPRLLTESLRRIRTHLRQTKMLAKKQIDALMPSSDITLVPRTAGLTLSDAPVPILRSRNVSGDIWAAAQRTIHRQTGVVVPAALLQQDPSMETGEIQLTFQPASPPTGDESPVGYHPTIELSLMAALPSLLGIVAVRWGLEQVRKAAPNLLFAIEAAMDEAALLGHLRARVSVGGSILNLQQTLEDVLIPQE